MRYKCLSIAGFDGSGGAGIQADIKTFSALGCYAMTVLTALPVQNTCGVKSCYKIPCKAISEQLEVIFSDIVPDSIKIGMLFTQPIIQLVANFLKKHAKNIPIVLDPVMMAKSGDALLLTDAIDALKKDLLPLATIITPNLPEAYALIGGKKDFIQTAEELLRLNVQAVLLKGGHVGKDRCDDLFFTAAGVKFWLPAERIKSKNTHGTGCTLSAAICAYLARGFSLSDACKQAKEYLHNAIVAAKDNSVGKGNGPVHHFYNLSRLYLNKL